jgi:hypothetical protein
MNARTAGRTPDRVPQEIARTLRRLIWRTRMVLALRGVGAVAALVLSLLLAVMAVDAWVVIFDARVRYALSLSALGLTGLGALWLLARPLARSLSMEGIARAIEAHHPELQERISSAVELLSSRDMPEVRGSEVLIAALAEEAGEDVRAIRPAQEITLRPARPALGLGVSLAAVLGALLLVWPTKTPRLLLRAVAPHLNLPNVRAEDLTVVPGDAVVARGESLRVTASVDEPAVRSAQVRIPAPDGTEAAVPMARVFDPQARAPRFRFSFPAAQESFRYRIHAGDALSRYYSVKVVPFPAVTGLDLRYDYPGYTGLEPRVEQDAAGDIAAVAGTTVTVTARTNTAVARAELLVDGKAVPAGKAQLLPGPDGTTECVFRLKLEPGLAGRWKARLTDVYGFVNNPVPHDVKALPDSPPTVAVLQPEEKQLRLAPADKLPLAYLAADDFGITAGELLLESDQGALPAMPVPLEGDGRGPARGAAGAAVLDLGALDLRGALRLTFRLRATDNLPAEQGGPQAALSDAYTVEIDRKAPLYAEQALLTYEEQVRAALRGVLSELQAARDASAGLTADMAKPGSLSPPAQEQLDGMLHHLDAAAGSARTLAENLEGSLYEALSPRLASAADERIARAEGLAAEAKLTDAPEERGRLADESDVQTGLAMGAVSDMLDDFEAMAEAARRELALEGLAQEQAQLADARQAMEQAQAPEGKPGPGMTADEWQGRQRETAGKVDAALREAVQGSVRDLAAEARALQRRQESLTHDTRQLQQAQELDALVASLAQQQRALAQEATGDQLSAPQAGMMDEAAQDITAARLGQATLKQGEAARALGDRAGGLQQELRTADLASRMEALAPQQRELAGQAQQAKEAVAAARAAGQTPDASAPGQLAERQRQIAGQAAESGELTRDAGWQTQEFFRRYGPAEQMQQAAQALQAGEADKGAEAAARAAERAERLAAELRKASDRAQVVENKQGRAQALADLSRRQAELQWRTRDAMNRRKDAVMRLQEGHLARLQKEQAEVALRAAELAERTGTAAPQPDRLETEAAAEAAKAARRLQARQLPEAGQTAEEAGRMMADLSERLGGTPEDQAREPGPAPALAADAASLAERQARLAREIGMLAESQHAPLTASGQEALAEGTGDLGAEAGRVADQLQEDAAQSAAGADARTAAAQLDRAGQAQRTAVQAIAGGQTPNALPPQQESASALNEAAQALERMGRRLAEASDPARWARLGREQLEEVTALAEASNAAREAASTLQAEAASRAAGHLRAAQEHAAARSQRMGLRPAVHAGGARAAVPGRYATPYGVGMRRAQYLRKPPPRLDEMGITLQDWAKLPGHLQDDILQAAGEDTPPEYRLLIKRYFEAVARQGGTRPQGAEQ